MKAIDLFAGLGGMTQGAQAAGIDVVWAANHWPEAVATHAKNHFGTQHECQDLHQANWSQVPDHDLLLASPCCQGHSKARGKDTAAHDASRSTAWAVVSAAEYHSPEVFVVENVQEFLDWKLYPAWELAMKSLGYSLSPQVLDAADFGVPQNRVRMFLVGTKSANPIQLQLEKQEHQAFRPHIQWDADWAWTNVSDKAPKTQARVANGRRKLGTDRFVAPFYGSGSGLTGRSLDRPIGTLTTKDRYLLVDGDKCRVLQVPEVLAGMGFPLDYNLPLKKCGNVHKTQSVHMLGNSVCPPVVTAVINAVKEAA
jgi:DNA (cytosine-5)-methyltransferase 1